VERLGGSRRAQAEEREREEKNGHELQGFGRVLAHKPTSLLHGNKNQNCQQKAKILWARQRKNAQCSGSNPRTLHKIGRTFACSLLISLTRCRLSPWKSKMRCSCIGASASAGQLKENVARKMRKQLAKRE
jgi:hypothetical protein